MPWANGIEVLRFRGQGWLRVQGNDDCSRNAVVVSLTELFGEAHLFQAHMRTAFSAPGLGQTATVDPGRQRSRRRRPRIVCAQSALPCAREGPCSMGPSERHDVIIGLASSERSPGRESINHRRHISIPLGPGTSGILCFVAIQSVHGKGCIQPIDSPGAFFVYDPSSSST